MASWEQQTDCQLEGAKFQRGAGMNGQLGARMDRRWDERPLHDEQPNGNRDDWGIERAPADPLFNM